MHPSLGTAPSDSSAADTLPRIWEHGATRHPNRPALLSGDRDPISHRDLWDHVFRSVQDLRRLGLGRGDRIAFALPQGVDLALTFLAVTAGATAVPLNPASSGPEFESLFRDLRPQALILGEGDAPEVRGIAGALGIPVLDLVAGTGPGRMPRLSGAVRPCVKTREV